MKNRKIPKKIQESIQLPTLCNLNPRSIYNKVDEFKEFIENEDIDVAFISESWERDDFPSRQSNRN